MRLGSALIVIWLVIGGFAAFQRGYFSGAEVNCARLSTVLVTMAAGPLNYFGVNPTIACEVPQPSP